MLLLKCWHSGTTSTPCPTKYVSGDTVVQKKCSVLIQIADILTLLEFGSHFRDTGFILN